MVCSFGFAVDVPLHSRFEQIPVQRKGGGGRQDTSSDAIRSTLIHMLGTVSYLQMGNRRGG